VVGYEKGFSMVIRLLSLLTLSFFLLVSKSAVAAEAPLRVGFFANVTHGQALMGKQTGAFEKKVGRSIDWKVFNAGPTAMEALIAGALDIAYVGPNPAVNAYFRSKGKALRIVAGAASGGAGLVVRSDAGIKSAADLKGRRVASPEFGNTQDVALRSWLKGKGLTPGKDVQVLPTKNPDILMLFRQKQVDAAWVPEPWLSRLLEEAGGTLLLDERGLWPRGEFSTAVVVVRADFLAKNRELVKRFLAAHVELTEWAKKEPAKARAALNAEYGAITRKPMPDKLLEGVFKRLSLSHEPLSATVVLSAAHASSLGFLPPQARDEKAVRQAFDLSILNEILRERKIR
jgi:NitT/TauT family transport system substrate-binding protein